MCCGKCYCLYAPLLSVTVYIMCFFRFDSDQEDSLYAFRKSVVFACFNCTGQEFSNDLSRETANCCKVDKFQSSSSETFLCCFFPKVTANDCLV